MISFMRLIFVGLMLKVWCVSLEQEVQCVEVVYGVDQVDYFLFDFWILGCEVQVMGDVGYEYCVLLVFVVYQDLG